MKSLKEFSASKPQKEELTEDVVSLEDYTLAALDEFDIQESANFKIGPVLPQDPPAMLVMRRTSVRMFPNGQRVAMYFVDKINKYITVPYAPLTWNSQMGLAGVKEELEINELDIIAHMKDIVENNSPKTIMFEDGRTKKVNVNTAENILELYSSLNTENKKMISEMGQQSRELFERVVDFAISNKK